MTESFSSKKPVLKLKSDSFLAKYNKSRMEVSDIKQLLLYPLAGCNVPQWASLDNVKGVRCVVLVTVDGLDEAAVFGNRTHFRKMVAVFGRAIQVNIPYSVKFPMQILRFYSRCTKTVRGLSVVKAQSRFGDKTDASLPLERYLLDKQLMEENKYPLESPGELRKDFITLDPLLPSAKNNRLLTRLENFSKVDTLDAANAAHIVAIDCEMVLTENGHELARVTALDFVGNAVYDQIVRPEAPVVDYCTRFSGIDAALMAGATKRLKDVQTDLKKLIFSDTIICGHSLESDLEALKLYHERVIDTSLLYPHTQGPPCKVSLKELAKKFLEQQIQNVEQGHNSAEDAKATLDMVKLKLSNGMAFGVKDLDFETIFSICRRFNKKTTLVAPAAVAKEVLKIIFFVNKKLVGADSSVSVITAESPQKCVAAAKAVLRGENCCGFVWAVVGNQKREDGAADEALTQAQIDAAVAELYGAARENTLFVVMTGHVEDKPLAEVHQKRRDWLKTESKEWPGEKAYQQKIANHKNGVCLAAMK